MSMSSSSASVPRDLSVPVLHYDDPPARPDGEIDMRTSITFTFKSNDGFSRSDSSSPTADAAAPAQPTASSSSRATTSSSSTMQLLPLPPPITLVPRSASKVLPDDVPCISVIPTASRTLVLLSATLSGNPELLGELRLNSKMRTGTFQIRSRRGPLIISDVFTRVAFVNRKCKKEARSTWQWEAGSSAAIYWDVSPSGRTLECFSSNYTPSSRFATLQTNSKKRELNITPAGWQFFDDVVMSALVLERWRWDGLM